MIRALTGIFGLLLFGNYAGWTTVEWINGVHDRAHDCTPISNEAYVVALSIFLVGILLSALVLTSGRAK